MWNILSGSATFGSCEFKCSSSKRNDDNDDSFSHKIDKSMCCNSDLCNEKLIVPMALTAMSSSVFLVAAFSKASLLFFYFIFIINFN